LLGKKGYVVVVVVVQHLHDKLENIRTMSVQIVLRDTGEFDGHHNILVLL